MSTESGTSMALDLPAHGGQRVSFLMWGDVVGAVIFLTLFFGPVGLIVVLIVAGGMYVLASQLRAFPQRRHTGRSRAKVCGR
jgi:hypothetical protein